MDTLPRAFSLVISTLGRCETLVHLLESLQRQSCQDFEVIIVDQSDDGCVAEALRGAAWGFPVAHMHTPGQRGLSRGRNVGWRLARGRYVGFPDDDCSYPPWLLAKVADRFEMTEADIITGRAADETGRSINGRYETLAQPICRANVWNTSIEWMTFLKREVLEHVGGYDESIGVGAGTPMQAAEGQDILLRALAAGFTGYFDPSVYGHHPELDIHTPDAAMQAKARAYGCGMGYVLGRHGHGFSGIARWLARPAAALLMHALCGRVARSRYYLNVLKGRWQGWRASRSTFCPPVIDTSPALRPLRLVVGIATSGRRDLLHETLGWLGHQARLPDRVIVCGASSNDADSELGASCHFPVTTLISAHGLPAQRNAILREAGDAEVIVFIDDDFLPATSYLAHAEHVLRRHPSVVLATGKLIADGIRGLGLTPAYARWKLADAPPCDPDAALKPYYGVYGCNMVVRAAPVRRHGASFDESLPLYAWQEDIDFSRQLAPFGNIVQTAALTGVHLGAKRGRASGVRLGYSQIANPLYLMRKGTMSVAFGARTMGKNLLANIVRLAWPEPHVDRLGRCRGNLIAVRDLLAGRLHPRRILDI